MTRVETLIYEYENCLLCGHCVLDRYKEDRWLCGLTDNTLWCTRLESSIPKWCPLPIKPKEGKLSFKEFLVLPVEERRVLLAEQASNPEIMAYYITLIHDEKALQDKGMMD